MESLYKYKPSGCENDFSRSYCPPDLENVQDFSCGFRNLGAIYKIGTSRAPTNTWAEFGVGRGVSAGRLVKLLHQDGQFFLFDSCAGLPEPWCMGDVRTEPAGSFSCKKPRLFDHRMKFIEGWFDETLPFNFKEQLGLIHIDCDLYSSTKTVLERIDPWIGPGTVMIFDELIGYQNYAQHEYRALLEWLEQKGRKITWVAKERFCVLGVVVC